MTTNTPIIVSFFMARNATEYSYSAAPCGTVFPMSLLYLDFLFCPQLFGSWGVQYEDLKNSLTDKSIPKGNHYLNAY
jgi:hypothetical protein